MLSVVEPIELKRGKFIAIKRGGVTVACLEYEWVRNAEDMFRADAGEEPYGGAILYVSNVRVEQDDPSLIWELHRQLPHAQWIVGLTEEWELRAPKGVPEWF